jgi:hypothetical protein
MISFYYRIRLTREAKRRPACIPSESVASESPPDITGAAGEFVVEGIQPGEWRIGPLPESERASDVAPRLQPLHIGEEQASVDLTITAYRELSISGRVLDIDGTPMSDVQLWAVGESGDSLRSTSAKDGSFVLAPAGPGELEVSSIRPTSPKVRARAGDTDVIVRPRRVGKIAGVVIDRRTQAPVEASLRVDCSGASTSTGTMRQKGSFSIDDIAPGTCDLRAITSDGAIGFLRGVVVTADESVEKLRVEVDAGATLELPEDAQEFFRVVDERGQVVCDILASFAPCMVPAGRVIVWRLGTQQPADPSSATELVLEPGERRRVEIGVPDETRGAAGAEAAGSPADGLAP